MARIKIEDLPVMEELTQEEMACLTGGNSRGGGGNGRDGGNQGQHDQDTQVIVEISF